VVGFAIMPTIKQLEEFTVHFRTLGNEAGISAERGIPYNGLPLPKTEAAGNPFANGTINSSDAQNDVLDNSQVDNQQDDDFDFGSFLDTIPDNLQDDQNETDIPNTKNIDDDFNFDDGLGDLLSGFADDIESAQTEPEMPDDFIDPEFNDPTIPGNAVDADFEELDDLDISSGLHNPPISELGDFDISQGIDDAPISGIEDFNLSEDSFNLDANNSSDSDFGDLDDFNFSEDVPTTDTEDVIHNDEMLSLFSEDPSDDAAQNNQDEYAFDIPELSGFPEIEDTPSDKDFSFDENFDSDFSIDEDAGFSTDEKSASETTIDAEDGSMSDDMLDGGFDFSIPEENHFDASDSIPSMDEEFSIPDMDDNAASGTDDSFDDMMGFGAGSFEMPDNLDDANANADIEELDSFDAFNLADEEPASSSINMPESDFNIDDVAYSADGDANDNNFGLDGIDDIFAESSEPGKFKTQAGKLHAKDSVEVEDIHLSQEELSKLIQTLNSYPLNLRIACEEIIAEQAVAPELMSDMIKKLVSGASPKDAANIAGKILGKKIPIPKGFLKKTGAELEAEQSTFAYIFVHSFLPILRTFSIFALFLFCLGFLIYQFIYIPVRAEGMYQRGYERIEHGEYARANENFIEALKIRQMKKWFFRYAEAFRDYRQYAYAEQKYDELLRFYPRDKQAALDYAHMQTYNLYNYEKANRILRDNILDYSIDDREGLFAQGENFLAWGEIDPSQLENARISFARLMERYGEEDIYLEQMLKYFIRTDNLAQVIPLQNYFLSSEKTNIAAPTLAELGGYLLDKKFEEVQGVPDANLDNIEGIRDVLFRAIESDATLPESHYHLARYYSQYGNMQEEAVVLETAAKAFDKAPELSAKRLGYRIDNQRRFAGVQIRNKYFVNAQENLIKGINLYEDALNRRVLSPSPDYGRLYADLADIDYFKDGDFDAALQNYLRAEGNGWSSPETIYRMGSIYYRTDRMADAMEHFFEASNEMPLNRRLLYALGNTSYMRGNYSAAQGYYNRLLDLLETEKVRATNLLPNDRPEHMELAERIMETQNNLGVTLGTLADRTGDVNYRTRALALYAESARTWDFITRNPETLVRLFVSGTEIPETNQSLLNTKYTLYPEPGFEPLIYNQIDMDVEDPSMWEELVPQE
jgi:tetratricopeptide (TPR) repeat protein